MEIRHLKLFVALAEEGSFTRAAKRMNIVQSGLSGSLKDLEEELGAELCTRTTRSVALTSAGSTFLKHAKLTLAAHDEARRSISKLNVEVRGRLSVGVLECCSPYIAIADVLDRFRQLFPSVKIQLRSLDNNQVIQAVRSGEIDVSCYALASQVLPQTLEWLPYREDSLLVICSLDHPFANLQSVSLEKVAAEAFVDASSEKALRWHVDEQFRKAGLHKDAAFEVDNPGLAIDLIEKNLGVGIIQAAIARRFAADRRIRMVPLSGGKARLPPWQFGLLRRRKGRAKREGDPVAEFLRMVLSQ